MNVADSIPVYLNRLHPHPITSKSTKDRWLLRAAKWIDQYLSNGPVGGNSYEKYRCGGSL